MDPEHKNIVRCPKCGEPQPGGTYNIDDYVLCAGCKSGLRIEAFPAMYQPHHDPSPKRSPVKADEASCFYHPANEAVVPCDVCGRFLCLICDIELGNRHICPSCFEKEVSRESTPELVSKRVRYDNIALHLAIFPVLMWFITIVTAPLTVFMCIRYWKTPLSVVPLTRVRFILAFFIAFVQIGLWGFLAVNLMG